MMIAILFRFPGLSSGVSLALQALLWTVALLIALALAGAVVMAVAPYLPQLLAAALIVAGYAGLTYPRKKGAQ